MKKLMIVNLVLAILAISLVITQSRPDRAILKAASSPSKSSSANLTKDTNKDKKDSKDYIYPNFIDKMNNPLPATTVIDWAELVIFYNYQSWPHSTNKKANDQWPQFIHNIKVPSNTCGNNAMCFYTYAMIDINGDGLMDMISHYELSYWDGVNSYTAAMAVWINQGTNNFQPIYKCVVRDSEGWYGDCAAV